MSELESEEILDTLTKGEAIIGLAEEYVSFCAENGGRLPNMSGFFRWLRLGFGELELLRAEHEDVYKTVMMIFEDEAINSMRPPSLVSFYMKNYFRTDTDEEIKAKSQCGPITLVFDHDISVDGE